MNLCPDFLGYLKADFLQGTETSWAAAALADGRKAGGAAVVVLAGGVGISAGAAATSAWWGFGQAIGLGSVHYLVPKLNF